MNYETKDASLLIIGIGAATLAFLLVASIFVSTWYYTARYSGPHAIPTAGRQTSFRQGPEQVNGVVRDYTDEMRASAARLNAYGWADRREGVARIPIDRAMQLLASGVQPAPAPKVPGQVP